MGNCRVSEALSKWSEHQAQTQNSCSLKTFSQRRTIKNLRISTWSPALCSTIHNIFRTIQLQIRIFTGEIAWHSLLPPKKTTSLPIKKNKEVALWVPIFTDAILIRPLNFTFSNTPQCKRYDLQRLQHIQCVRRPVKQVRLGQPL